MPQHSIVCQLLILIGICTATAQVEADAVITVGVEANPGGTFAVYLTGTGVDNFGVVSYGIPLVGSILTVDHNSPNGAASPLSGVIPDPIGFTEFRSADNQLLLSASQRVFPFTPATPYPLGG